ncbi:MAG: S9 family peptidase [Planctomycetota bacterium]|nr:S9 family peptidase [Planctomycetota bacterium]MDA1138339.1 S9 family peptidase [Planctomycetota bacterium]
MARQQQNKKNNKIKPEDLYRMELIGDCRISPDGEHVVYTVVRVEKESEKRFTNLWIVPAQGGRPKQFTYGDQDSGPRWSPDGKEIAFLSSRGKEKQSQIHIIPFDGGEARPLTRLQGAILSYEWSPDGKQFVCSFRKKDEEELEREKDEWKKQLGVVVRHFTRVHYKQDGAGFLPAERPHLWLINSKSGKATQLTSGEKYSEQGPAWSPDGKSIAFCSNRSDDPDFDLDGMDIFIMPAAGGRIRKLSAPEGRKFSPSFSPDGKFIAYIGVQKKKQWWRNEKLWLVPTRNSNKAVELTAGHDFAVNSLTLTDTASASMSDPVWSPDSKSVYFQISRKGGTSVMHIDVESRAIESVLDEEAAYGNLTLDRRGNRLACLRGDLSDPGQVCVSDLAAGAVRTLTGLNSGWLPKLDLGDVEEVWFKGAVKNDLQGWILKPPGFRPGRKYPSILYIHGGPLAQYGYSFMSEFYMLAAAGYVVYYCNPRGGSGYGEEHAKAIWNDWGGADYDDLMAFTDFVQRRPYLDRRRMGVTGGSYGGFMTNWIIGHTDRFQGAVTQRCVSNLISMYGSSDFNWAFQEVFNDEPPWENMENYWRQSPMKYIGNARTPTLVIHSEQDLRCNIEQGEQVFVALKKLGVDTEFVRFPDESHGLSRGGRTDRRIERINHIIRWFDKYLKGPKGK